MKNSTWRRRAAWLAGLVILVFAMTAGGWQWREEEGALKLAPDDEIGLQEKNSQAKSSIPKRELRYEGKSFADWQRILVTDLSPDLRKEALHVLSVFGVNGFGPEAIAAILETGGQYDVLSNVPEDAGVALAASSALGRLTSANMPLLLKELKEGGLHGRRLVASAFLFGYQPSSSDPNSAALGTAVARMQNTMAAQEFIQQAQQAGAQFDGRVNRGSSKGKAKNKASTASGGRGGAAPAGRALRYAEPLTVPIGPEGKKLVDALVQATRDPDYYVRDCIVQTLGRMGEAAAPAVPRLVELTDEPGIVINAWQAIAAIGCDDKVVLPPLMKLFNKDEEIAPGVYTAAAKVAPNLGEEANSLIEQLIGLYSKLKPSTKKMGVVEFLVGANADPAKLAPIVEDLISKVQQPGFRNDFGRPLVPPAVQNYAQEHGLGQFRRNAPPNVPIERLRDGAG
jgi:HEAT repeats